MLKRYQRGLALDLILVVVLVAASLGGLALLKHKYDSGIRKDERATVMKEVVGPIQKRADDCALALSTERATVQRVQANNAQLAATLKEQSKAVDDVKADADKRLAIAKAELAGWKRIADGLRASIAKNAAIAAGPPAANKEAACQAADAILEEYGARVRARGTP